MFWVCESYLNYTKDINFKVAQLAKSMIQIPFIMGYVVGLGLQNLELKILFQSDIRLLRY